MVNGGFCCGFQVLLSRKFLTVCQAPIRLRRWCLVIAVSSAAACSSPMEDMADTELADAVYSCRNAVDQSPAFAIRCDNYQRECARRRDDGNYVC